MVVEVFPMTERARLWQRVSTGGQDEASQLPDLMGWCDTRGYEYELNERYIVHGKSAYKKQQQAALDQVIGDMANGQYAVLVVWAFDRIQRGSTLEAFMLAEQARAAGGRIEYVLDTYLNETNQMSDVLLALAATAAREESKRKSQRVKIKHTALRANGSAVGRPPWGYQIICIVCNTPPRKPKCDSHQKVFAPTDEGRKYIPLIFQLVIDGKSLRYIAAWLDSHKVSTQSGKSWNEQYLGFRLIKNPVYYGHRRNSGQLETEALISYSTWQAANAALTSRVKSGRSTVKHEKALLSPVCGNPDCDASGEHPSPMYRTFTGKDRVPYYRCSGRSPQRHGCGNMVPLAELDAQVIEAMLSDHANMHVDRVFIPGDDRSDEIGRLREAGAEAMKRGDYATATDYMQKAAQLESEPRIAPHWEDRETGQTRGEHFATLDSEARREELAQNWEVFAYMVEDEGGRYPRFGIDPKDMAG
jgi:DNA invertase Pin-like site-specific DNA recombinase